MLRHFTSWTGRLVVAGIFSTVLVACHDQQVTQPAQPLEARVRSDVLIPGCQVGRISQLGMLLSPHPMVDPDFDLTGSMTVVLSLSQWQLALAQQAAIKLAGLLGDPRILAKLNDPGTPTKSQAVGELVTLLFGCVQLTAPDNLGGAYAPDGGIKVIGTAGGSLTTRDGYASVEVPAGAVTGDHVFSIATLPNLAKTQSCVPGAPAQYNQCYDYGVTPYVHFAVKVKIGMCTLPAIGAPYGTPSEEVHNRLRIASADPADPTKIIIYDRIPVALNCAGATVAQAPPGAGASAFGSTWTAVANMAHTLTRWVAPRPAYAADGLGCGVISFSHKTAVDPVLLETGFETASPAWTTTGFWHRSTFKNSDFNQLSNTAYPMYVSLGAGDGSTGALPSPFSGSYAMWYGEDATGNFAGPLMPDQSLGSGGTSVTANAGTVSSPAFRVPSTVNLVRLGFQSWFEIESMNASTFDIMEVQVEDTALPEVKTRLTTLNPLSDPAGRTAPMPFTSGGFNTAPVWKYLTADLSAYRGKTIRLHFSFATKDVLYNGFRGWIIDNLAVTIASQTAPSFNLIPLPAAFDVAPTAPLAPRVWHP